MSYWYVKAAGRLGALAATALLGGLATAALVRTSPGFTVDEAQLDPRLSAESREFLKQERAANRNVAHFYASHIGNMLRGDFGVSPSLNRPIAELIGARAPVTLELMAIGVGGGWAVAFALALLAVFPGRWGLSRIIAAMNSLALCVPAAAIAVLVFVAGGPAQITVGLALFPRLFEFIRNLLRDAYASPHIVTARAKGLRPARILFRHVIPVCAPELLALAGVSVAMAFGAAIPVETLCDLPGIGQLAWKAAISRDLPVLVTLTMLIALLTQVCNAVSDWATAGLGRSRT